MNAENHPCFNEKAHRKYGRVHLPVAPRCNIQCRYCNRQFDCVNESRPGVTSAVLAPHQALVYLDNILEAKPNIAVAGIAGPGDPMANPEETIETLYGVREKYPDMLLCLATNGLNLEPYVDQLADIGVSHVTVTVNAVDPEIGEQMYSWVRYGRRVYRAAEGVRILMERQQAAIERLKQRGVTVKINFIVIPGINEHHVGAVAEKMAALGVDRLNCVAYRPAPGSAFENVEEPSPAAMKTIRTTGEKYLPQMRHCTRCRADAAGLLGEATDRDSMNLLRSCAAMPEDAGAPRSSGRPYVAVASLEGMLVNQHLGEAEKLLIYGETGGGIGLVEARTTPERGSGSLRWRQMADTLSDCHTLLVSGIGENPKQALKETGIEIMVIDGMIEEAVRAVYSGQSLRHMIRREESACGGLGAGMGCG